MSGGRNQEKYKQMHNIVYVANENAEGATGVEGVRSETVDCIMALLETF